MGRVVFYVQHILCAGESSLGQQCTVHRHRIGSDDEGGLTKAINNVFPNAARFVCSKHIKNNVTDHIKNILPITKDKRSDIMSNIFGDNGIINADDTTDFDVRSENLCSSFPVFADYFNSKLK